tara:strand:+ start:1348 stop:1599 length:252 start_codon:yes stop_codon:yes gene_type:complete
MSEHLKKDTQKNANVKLWLYIVIAVLTSALTQLAEVTTEALTWNEWGIFGISIILPGLIVWRAFVDKTQSRVDHANCELEEKK